MDDLLFCRGSMRTTQWWFY